MYPCACGGQYYQSPKDGRCLRCSNFFPAAQLGQCPTCQRTLCIPCLQAAQENPKPKLIQPLDGEGMPV